MCSSPGQVLEKRSAWERRGRVYYETASLALDHFSGWLADTEIERAGGHSSPPFPEATERVANFVVDVMLSVGAFARLTANFPAG